MRASIPLHFRIVDAEGNIIVQTPEADLPKPADLMSEAVSVMYFPEFELPHYGRCYVQLGREERYIIEKKLTVTAPEENDDG